MGDRAERQAEAIVDAFLADEEPEDLLRLVQAIAEALRSARKRANLQEPTGPRGSLGKRAKRKNNRSGSRSN